MLELVKNESVLKLLRGKFELKYCSVGLPTEECLKNLENFKVYSAVLGNVKYYVVSFDAIEDKSNEVLASAIMDNDLKNIILAKCELIENLINNKNSLDKEILLHEIEHIKRGLVKFTVDDYDSVLDLAEIYYKEEQVINAKVAPTLFKMTKESYENNDLKMFIIGGINMTFFKSKEDNEKLKSLDWGTLETMKRTYLEMEKLYG